MKLTSNAAKQLNKKLGFRSKKKQASGIEQGVRQLSVQEATR